MPTKKCLKCKKQKPEDQFSSHGRSARLHPWCKLCRAKKARFHYKRNRASILARQKARGREHVADVDRKSKYGITKEAYALLVSKHKGICPICSKARKLVLDHCHNTGKVRGLLCSRCNIGLGHFNDDVNALQSAITYLKDP